MENSVQKIVIHRLCQGCGACYYICSEGAIEMHDYVDIGIRPNIDADKCTDCGNCLKVCSGFDLSHKIENWPQDIIKELSFSWGPVLEIWEGHAADNKIRVKGGSGGVVTAISLFCIEQKNMHGVLHVQAKRGEPHLSSAVLSTKHEEIFNGAASRYSPIAICAELDLIEKSPGPCVLVGKPCDIASSLKVQQIQPHLDQKIGLTISIFCGGTPSTRGTLKIIEELGLKVHEIEDLRYRGHGWPGMTGVKVTNRKNRIEMTYQQAWDTILTKYKPFRCHICPDGTGEFADISCGDPWYRKREKGDNGTTLIIVRTKRGKEVLHDAISSGYINSEQKTPDVLPLSQIGLLRRREHVLNKLFWLKIFQLPCPAFKGFSLWKNWSNLPIKRKIESFWKTGKWIFSFRKHGPLQFKN